MSLRSCLLGLGVIGVLALSGCGAKNTNKAANQVPVDADILAEEHNITLSKTVKLDGCRDATQRYVAALTLKRPLFFWGVTFPEGTELTFNEPYNSSCLARTKLNSYIETVFVPKDRFVSVTHKGREIKLNGRITHETSTYQNAITGFLVEDFDDAETNEHFAKGNRVSFSHTRY